MLLLDLINIPGLHVMTGNVGKLIGEMEKVFPDPEQGKDFVDKFLASIIVHRAEYQGSHSFEGNHARRLLRRIGLMRPVAEKLPVDLRNKVMEFIKALEAFNNVVVACFGKTIEGDHIKAIADYSRTGAGCWPGWSSSGLATAARSGVEGRECHLILRIPRCIVCGPRGTASAGDWTGLADTTNTSAGVRFFQVWAAMMF